MFSKAHNSNRIAWSGLALLAVALSPTAGRAETILFRNDTNTDLVLQITAVYQMRVQRPRPLPLNAKSSSPPINLLGDKHIIIYDANVPGRVLLKVTIPGGPVN